MLQDPTVIALALGALLASLSTIITSACRDMFEFEIFDDRDGVGNWTHPGRAAARARRCLRATARFIFVLYATSVGLLLAVRLPHWIPDGLPEADDVVNLLNYVTVLLLGWLLWLSAKVTHVRTRREQGVSP